MNKIFLVTAYDFQEEDISETIEDTTEDEAIFKVQAKYNNDPRYYNWEAEEILNNKSNLRYYKCLNCGNYQVETEFGECGECGMEELVEITEKEYETN